MIAEQLVREALGVPTPLEVKRRLAKHQRDLCLANLRRAKERGDCRSIASANTALIAATAELLRVGA